MIIVRVCAIVLEMFFDNVNVLCFLYNERVILLLNSHVCVVIIDYTIRLLSPSPIIDQLT